MRLMCSNIKYIRICHYRDNLIFTDVILKNGEKRHYCANRDSISFQYLPKSVVKFIFDDLTSKMRNTCPDYPLYSAIMIYKRKEGVKIG